MSVVTMLAYSAVDRRRYAAFHNFRNCAWNNNLLFGRYFSPRHYTELSALLELTAGIITGLPVLAFLARIPFHQPSSWPLEIYLPDDANNDGILEWFMNLDYDDAFHLDEIDARESPIPFSCVEYVTRYVRLQKESSTILIFFTTIPPIAVLLTFNNSQCAYLFYH